MLFPKLPKMKSKCKFTSRGGSSALKSYQIKYSKTCVKRPLSKRPNVGFQDKLTLNRGQKYCRMLQKGSTLKYFRPSLRYNLSLRLLFCLILSGRLRQVLLYKICHRSMPKRITFDINIRPDRRHDKRTDFI